MITRRCILYTRYHVGNLIIMASGPLRISKKDLRRVEKSVDEVMGLGKEIRSLFSKYNDEEFDVGWEVDSLWTHFLCSVRDGQLRFLQLYTLPAIVDSMK